MKRSFKLNPLIVAGVLLLFLAVPVIGADTGGFLSQTITLPAKDMNTCFADLNGGGRFDLLAVDSIGNQLLIYRQRTTGFTAAPDQIIELPPNTAWISPFRVEARTNFDLLVSTATGLSYYRQDGGAFEPKPRPLLKANQVFTGDNSPVLLAVFTNAAIPIISATQAWLYQRNNELEWTSGPPMILRPEHGNWRGSRNGWSGWSLGPDAARTLEVQRRYRVRPQPSGNYTPENDGIAKLIATLKKSSSASESRPQTEPQTTEVDLDGDGRKDLVVWQVSIESWRTELFVFLRGADGRLPDRPTQILHCRGIPLPINSTWTWSPIADLKGDGKYELVLVEQDFIVTSIGSLVDMALTRGVKFALTVRPFNLGGFARTAETAVSFKTLLSIYGSWQWTFFICGDFNSDGRPDLVVMRPDGQWEIYYSTTNGRWFEPKPSMTFALPAQGYFERRYFEISDLNGDGRSDIVSHDLDNPRMFILLTKPLP